MGVVAAGAVAAAAARAREDLLERFRVAQATAPERAKRIDELGIIQDRFFKHFLESGVVIDVGSDRYYLDETAVAALRRTSRGRAKLIAVIAALLALAVAAAGMFMGMQRHP